ncbi:MAG: hypothetical protein Q7R62_00995 [bacterium]|nr:hypothetical protein [bacterium]
MLAIPVVVWPIEVPVQPAIVVPPVAVEHALVRVRNVSMIIFATIPRAAYFSYKTETLSAT